MEYKSYMSGILWNYNNNLLICILSINTKLKCINIAANLLGQKDWFKNFRFKALKILEN